MDIPKTAYPLDFYRQRVKSQHCGREWSIAIDFTDARILPKTLTLPLSILLSTLTLFSALLLSRCVGYKSILKLAVGLSCRAQLIDQTSGSIWEPDQVFDSSPLHRHTSSHTHEFVGTPVVTQVGNFVHLANPCLVGQTKHQFCLNLVGASCVNYCTSLNDHA